MDTSSTIIGLGMLLLFVGPIMFLLIKQNKKEKAKLIKFTALSEENNINPEMLEITNDLILGLDSKAKKLLVVEPQNNHQHRIVDLAEIKKSKVSTIDIPNRAGKINHVSLELFGKNERNKVAEIIFYDEDDNENLDADARLVIANKWDRIIKNAI